MARSTPREYREWCSFLLMSHAIVVGGCDMSCRRVVVDARHHRGIDVMRGLSRRKRDLMHQTRSHEESRF